MRETLSEAYKIRALQRWFVSCHVEYRRHSLCPPQPRAVLRRRVAARATGPERGLIEQGSAIGEGAL
uniref:Uncharacterized protein n=1 Tax=viral metagenome TaxID=1070528 RepID=A0A6H1Z9I2_9ZZZZ